MRLDRPRPRIHVGDRFLRIRGCAGDLPRKRVGVSSKGISSLIAAAIVGFGCWATLDSRPGSEIAGSRGDRVGKHGAVGRFPWFGVGGDFGLDEIQLRFANKDAWMRECTWSSGL